MHRCAQALLVRVRPWAQPNVPQQGTVAANTSSSSQGGQGSLKELGGFVGFNVEGSLSTKGKSQNNTCDLAYRRGTSCRSHTHVGECGGTHTRSWSERRGRVREGAGGCGTGGTALPRAPAETWRERGPNASLHRRSSIEAMCSCITCVIKTSFKINAKKCMDELAHEPRPQYPGWAGPSRWCSPPAWGSPTHPPWPAAGWPPGS